jgi:hypothetical protein
MEQTALNYLFAAVGALMGWILKVVWDSVQALKGDVQTIERNLPNVYVRRDDFREATRELRADMQGHFARIENTLAVLFKKLDAKEDK